MDEKNRNADIENKLFEKYKLLINARNFHYDNFNKWASYFYIAIGAILVAYYTVVCSKEFEEKKLLEFIIISLGFIFSCLWYWSIKGYYYWNINFITLVNNYEKKIFKWKKKERIYFIHANKNTQNNYASPIMGANISTSKVAIFFSYLVTLTWGFLLFYNIIKGNCNKSLEYTFSFILSLVTIYILSVTFAKSKLFSKIDHFSDLGIKQ